MGLIAKRGLVMTKKDEFVLIADYASADEPMSLDEFLEITHLSPDVVYNYIQYDIIHPQGAEREQWAFDLNHIKRVQRALRLQRDLEVNLAGVAVVLDLLDEIDHMRSQIELLDKLYNK